jgi:hypothetical protein
MRIACRDRGSRRVAAGGIDTHVDTVCDEPSQRRPEGRIGECVRILADEQRPVDALARAVAAYRLGRGGDVGLVERAVEGRTAMAGGPERDALGRVAGVRPDLEIRATSRSTSTSIDGSGGRPAYSLIAIVPPRAADLRAAPPRIRCALCRGPAWICRAEGRVAGRRPAGGTERLPDDALGAPRVTRSLGPGDNADHRRHRRGFEMVDSGRFVGRILASSRQDRAARPSCPPPRIR